MEVRRCRRSKHRRRDRCSIRDFRRFSAILERTIRERSLRPVPRRRSRRVEETRSSMNSSKANRGSAPIDSIRAASRGCGGARCRRGYPARPGSANAATSPAAPHRPRAAPGYPPRRRSGRGIRRRSGARSPPVPVYPLCIFLWKKFYLRRILSSIDHFLSP